MLFLFILQIFSKIKKNFTILEVISHFSETKYDENGLYSLYKHQFIDIINDVNSGKNSIEKNVSMFKLTTREMIAMKIALIECFVLLKRRFILNTLTHNGFICEIEKFNAENNDIFKFNLAFEFRDIFVEINLDFVNNYYKYFKKY
ncbi:hypothetical protein TUBRATIS_002560 [Tubulinosema ratisbonensis]|uniref:Uncharacterized protein n=1 Tax=Tubulinosema ratisbonensis TaxID=291195 RepID=A0A437APW7_9MICR|nr:hypothetical protein TUBRATIS_002560 [Tubulinosema ratisbonensis]